MFFFYSLYIDIGRYTKNPYRHSSIEYLSNFLTLMYFKLFHLPTGYTKLTTHHGDKDGNEIITTLSDINVSLPADICHENI